MNHPETPKSPPAKTPTRKSIGHAWSVADSLDFATEQSFRSGSRGLTRKSFLFSLLAHFIDQLLMLSLVLVSFSIALYFNRGHNTFLAEANGHLRLMIPAICLYGLLLTLYMTIPRIFLGCTPGEWTCNLRVGSPEQRFSSRYTFLILKRVAICFWTGGIVLLLLSIVTGRDWAGKLSKVPLVDRD